ncbi:DUF202 domain-containing protein [Salmonella enterica]|uniref:DUF202 domain-containing protein n=3 Tax=Salmonella enterica TaxID=28901 RepID=A0A749WPM9_SALER|nr:DUF202 domain-containing protein [Salmonella enterica subsp. enterica serovar Koketime]EAB8208374.1 DUF202 domain-containing protein [Salmonella enterica subsp. enterica serovar Lattenkamp]EAM8932784.1 DUF202 domain-containing protein [Salmonella enterica]ECJ3924197.1 DUF202 domain-containing protein [Salmonella enterica subsp. enterica]EHG3460082.1 DUF202 domain-containing protein [Salmonella enterica subsp. enterica serovar Moero]
MIVDLRPCDPGLQPQRTALAWHRTTFSVFVLALVTARVGFARGSLASGWVGSLAVGLAIVLMIVTHYRQQQVIAGGELTTPASVLTKRLLSIILGLEAVSLVLPAALSLLPEGVF